MKEILEKLNTSLITLEKERGPVLIFALFLREDPLEKWDILVSAPWLNASDMDAYRIVVSDIRKELNSIDFMKFARLVILDPEDPVVPFLLELEPIKNGEYKELPIDELSERFKFTIKKAYILRAHKPQIYTEDS